MPVQAPAPTPAVSSASTSRSASIEQLSQSSAQNVEVGGGFSEVLDLVKPREAIQAKEPVDERAEIREPSSSDRADGRAEISAREEQGADKAPQEIEGSAHAKEPAQGAERGMSAAEADDADQTKVDRADALKVIQQLSQEDLLKLIELSEGQTSGLQTELTAFEAEAIPAIQALSGHELMALLHGFQDAQQPTHQGLASELIGQTQLQEQALTQGASQQLFTQQLTQQMNQQVNQPQLNLNAVMPMMESVVRPQEVMPALNQVKLSASQREGIIRQVANGFRTRSGGTQTTEIRLNPEELGLVRLKVEMRGADVRVFFSAENPAVMDLLSQNIDQLKALLTEQEFNLTEAGVWQEFNSQGGSQGDADDEDYGSDERPDLRHRPKNSRGMSPLPGRFRATI